MNSQTNQILAHLKNKNGITAFEALDRFGCFRLAARIKDLREAGNNIETTMIETDQGKRVARYFLISEAQDVH